MKWKEKKSVEKVLPFNFFWFFLRFLPVNVSSSGGRLERPNREALTVARRPSPGFSAVYSVLECLNLVGDFDRPLPCFFRGFTIGWEAGSGWMGKQRWPGNYIYIYQIGFKTGISLSVSDSDPGYIIIYFIRIRSEYNLVFFLKSVSVWILNGQLKPIPFNRAIRYLVSRAKSTFRTKI